jgi:hypothetical protein
VSIIPLILQPPPAMGVICCRMQTRHLIVGLALIVVSCASPDRNVYDFASREHARWAQQSREKAAADEATARSLAERGDHLGANDAESAARQAVGDAQTQQLQANKDHWLSQWWPAR